MLHCASSSRAKRHRPSKKRADETAKAKALTDRYTKSVIDELRYLLVTSPYDSDKKFPFGIIESQGNEEFITGLDLPNSDYTDGHLMCCVFTHDVVNYEHVRGRDSQYMMGDAGPAILYCHFEKHSSIHDDIEFSD